MLSTILRWPTLLALLGVGGSFWAFMLYGLAFVAHPTVWVPIACTICGWLFVILVHETGHAVAAVACGWRVLVFAVHPFGLHLPSRTIAFVPRRHREGGASGYVAAVPGSLARGTAARWMIVLASGPAACLMLAVGALIVRDFWLRALDTPGLVASNFGSAIAIQASLSALMSLLPYGRSDGAQLLAAARRTAEWDLYRPAVWMQTMLKYNLRLRDVPAWVVAALRDTLVSPEERARYLEGIEIGRALDAAQLDTQRARTLIDAYRARHGGNAWLDSCDTYLAAIGEKDAERAAARLWQGEPDPAVLAMQHAAKASVLAAQGDGQGVDFELRDMRRAVRAQSPFRNQTFRDIERAIRARLRSV